MRTLKVVFASLLLVMVLDMSGAIPLTVHADDGRQGGSDSVKKPKCYPRCPVLPPKQPASNSEQAEVTADSFNTEEFVESIVINIVSFL